MTTKKHLPNCLSLLPPVLKGQGPRVCTCYLSIAEEGANRNPFVGYGYLASAVGITQGDGEGTDLIFQSDVDRELLADCLSSLDQHILVWDRSGGIGRYTVKCKLCGVVSGRTGASSDEFEHKSTCLVSRLRHRLERPQ